MGFEFTPHTTKLYSNCLVVNYIDHRGIYCHVFIHEGDRIKNTLGTIYTVTGITDKGIMTKYTGSKPAETGETDLIYFFKAGFWTITDETKQPNHEMREADLWTS